MQTSRAAVVALFVGLVVGSAATPARADAVMPPPADCPPGAAGATSHNGPWCSPTTCSTDADCAGVGAQFDARAPARVCVEQALCVEAREEKSQSGWSHGQPFARTFAHGVCSAEVPCAAPAKCEAAKRCVVPTPGTVTPTQPEPEPAPSSSPETRPAPASGEQPPAAASGSRCRVAGSSEPTGALWLLGALGLAWRRRPITERGRARWRRPA